MRNLILSIAIISLQFKMIVAQEQIKGNSLSKDFKMQIPYKPGLPPNLFADLQFADDNGNGILEAEEKAELKIILTNKGSGRAQGLKIKVIDILNNDLALQIIGDREIQILNPGKSVELIFSLTAGINIHTAKHKFKISVSENFGYDMDPAFLEFQTFEYQAPKLAFAGLNVFDTGEGTVSLVKDGMIQAGEMIKTKIIVQNIGQKIAKNVKYKVVSTDPNVYLTGADGNLDDINIGQVKDFSVTISPNKRMESKNSLPVFLTLTLDKAKGGLENYALPLAVNQKPPETNILQIKADIEGFLSQLPHFEIDSNRFTANFGKIINIREVSPAVTIQTDAVAVIFGIENYLDYPKAPYAENDARIIKEYFKTRLGINNIVMYTSGQAKGLIFDDVFNPAYGELQKAIVKGQTNVYVFYSGHGIPSKDGQQIFLFPADGRIERLEMQGYNLNKLYENLDSLGAKSVTVFLDACFTGSSRNSEKINTENLVSMKGIRVQPKLCQPWSNNPNFSVFSSSGSGETSLSFDASQTGLFTYFLCAGLQGYADKNQDKLITQGELYQYIREEVMNASRKISGIQTPEFHGNPEMVLVEL